jgi:predicted GNAT superfamily acetyltransferase
MAIMRTLEIRPTTVADLMDHGSDLFQQHWAEIALNKDVMQLSPDRARYEALETAGKLIVLGAYENSVLIGYSVSFLNTHFHYSNLTVAQNDLIFLVQRLRGTRLGYELFSETEKAAVAAGARMMMWHAKPDTSMAQLMPRMFYGIQDIIFSKVIA